MENNAYIKTTSVVNQDFGLTSKQTLSRVMISMEIYQQVIFFHFLLLSKSISFVALNAVFFPLSL